MKKKTVLDELAKMSKEEIYERSQRLIKNDRIESPYSLADIYDFKKGKVK